MGFACVCFAFKAAEEVSKKGDVSRESRQLSDVKYLLGK